MNLEDNIKHIDTSIIPIEQLEEIYQYKQIQDKNKRLISRTFLFKYLKKNYDLTDFTFSYTDIKRPIIQNTAIDFNISYSKDLIAVAVSTKDKIGIDIEYIDSRFDINSVIEECMNTKELKIFYSLTYNKKVNYFYSLFTYKEALAKFLGSGLYLDLKEITNLEVNNFNICKYQPFISSNYSCTIVRSNFYK